MAAKPCLSLSAGLGYYIQDQYIHLTEKGFSIAKSNIMFSATVREKPLPNTLHSRNCVCFMVNLHALLLLYCRLYCLGNDSALYITDQKKTFLNKSNLIKDHLLLKKKGNYEVSRATAF